HLQQLAVGGNESVAVDQALGVGRQAGQALFFPEDLALEIAFGDFVAVILCDEDPVAADHVGIDRVLQPINLPAWLVVAANFHPAPDAVVLDLDEQRVPQPAPAGFESGQVHGVPLPAPPGGPGLPALLSGIGIGAEGFSWGLVAGQENEEFLGLTSL